MADYWIMEPAAALVPCDLGLANKYWTIESAPHLHEEYHSTEVSGDCLQTCDLFSKERQLFESAAREYDTVEKAEQEFVVDFHNMETTIVRKPIQVFRDVAVDFSVDIEMMGRKIHRYPASIQALCLSERYTIPMVVSIGPYHHGRERRLDPAEKVKHVAAYRCISSSGHTVQEMYDAVVSVARGARSLYDKDVMEGMNDNDFLPMMFFDACFLVQYMLSMCVTEMDEEDAEQIRISTSLHSFFDSNDNEIYHDIMLLENQLPWPLVQAVMRFVPVPLQDFINSVKGCLQDRKNLQEETMIPTVTYDDPPHLLGLLRFYIAGENKKAGTVTNNPNKSSSSSISFSVSAVELAEIGITLKPSETTELIHMGLETKGTLFGELSLAPLSLDSSRASWLINMAALELCTTSNFTHGADEESAVCSYLLFLAMLVDKEEDVQELRTKRLLQGGGGLSNREALDFLASVQGLRLGSRYVCIMEDIQNYREKWRTRTSVHAFLYRNIKIIAAVLSAIVTIVSILGTLLSIKN
jgi:hypothetical protein